MRRTTSHRASRTRCRTRFARQATARSRSIRWTGDFLNARNAYDYYGFDAFYDGTEYGLGWESHDADLLKVFERIYADEKRVHPDQPLFVFMLTLHQHGPHMTPLARLPPPYDKRCSQESSRRKISTTGSTSISTTICSASRTRMRC